MCTEWEWYNRGYSRLHTTVHSCWAFHTRTQASSHVYSWLSQLVVQLLRWHCLPLNAGQSRPNFIQRRFITHPCLNSNLYSNNIVLVHYSMTFPFLFQGAMGPYAFLVFIACVVVFGIFMYFKLPETKNKTYEELYKHFKTGRPDVSPKLFLSNSAIIARKFRMPTEWWNRLPYRRMGKRWKYLRGQLSWLDHHKSMEKWHKNILHCFSPWSCHTTQSAILISSQVPYSQAAISEMHRSENSGPIHIICIICVKFALGFFFNPCGRIVLSALLNAHKRSPAHVLQRKLGKIWEISADYLGQ